MEQREKRQRQIQWRCRRGARELDLLLSAFVDRHYRQMNDAERRHFDRLLQSPDPQLSDWLCQDAQPTDPEIAALVKRIRAAHRD